MYIKKHKLFFSIFFIALFSIALSIGYIFHHDKVKLTSFCSTTNSEKEILGCNINSLIDNQTKYNMFYYHPEFHDETYVSSFDAAYNECSSSKECSVHDSAVLDSVRKKCAIDGTLSCASVVIDKPTVENLNIFDITITKNYYHYQNNPGHTMPCDNSLYIFFKNLNNEQKSHLSQQTIDICNEQDAFYEKHPKLQSSLKNYEK